MYPELLNAKLVQREGLLHESCLYTIAAVVESTAMSEFYKDLMVPTHRSLFLQEDALLAKKVTCVLSTYEDIQLRQELQLDTRLQSIVATPVVEKLQHTWLETSPFGKTASANGLFLV